MTIWEYHLTGPSTSVLVSAEYNVLSCGLDLAGKPAVWIAIHRDLPQARRIVFHQIWTGSEVPINTSFVGTLKHDGFVNHIFLEQ